MELMHSITEYDPKCCTCLYVQLVSASISMNSIQLFRILGENASDNSFMFQNLQLLSISTSKL